MTFTCNWKEVLVMRKEEAGCRSFSGCEGQYPVACKKGGRVNEAAIDMGVE